MATFYCFWKCRNLVLRIAEIICIVMPESFAFDQSSIRAVEATKTILPGQKEPRVLTEKPVAKEFFCATLFLAYLVIENKKSLSRKPQSLGWQSFYFDGLFGGRELPFRWGAGMFGSLCYTLEKSKANILESLSEETGFCAIRGGAVCSLSSSKRRCW